MEDAPEAPRKLRKLKGPQQACRKRVPEYMEDARDAIRRQSTWKTPGGGRQNAAARRFVGQPAPSKLATAPTSGVSSPAERRPDETTTSNGATCPGNKAGPPEEKWE